MAQINQGDKKGFSEFSMICEPSVHPSIIFVLEIVLNNKGTLMNSITETTCSPEFTAAETEQVCQNLLVGQEDEDQKLLYEPCNPKASC